MKGPFEDTAQLDPEPIRLAEAREIQRRYGVTAWFGYFTGHWWALVDRRRLVEAPTPHRLGAAIMSARRRS